MINKLINLANILDESGLKKEADRVDALIKRSVYSGEPASPSIDMHALPVGSPWVDETVVDEVINQEFNPEAATPWDNMPKIDLEKSTQYLNDYADNMDAIYPKWSGPISAEQAFGPYADKAMKYAEYVFGNYLSTFSHDYYFGASITHFDPSDISKKAKVSAFRDVGQAECNENNEAQIYIENDFGYQVFSGCKKALDTWEVPFPVPSKISVSGEWEYNKDCYERGEDPHKDECKTPCKDGEVCRPHRPYSSIEWRCVPHNPRVTKCETVEHKGRKYTKEFLKSIDQDIDHRLVTPYGIRTWDGDEYPEYKTEYGEAVYK